MKKKNLIIIIAVVLVIAIAIIVAVAVSKNGGNEKDLIFPEAKNDKIETKLPDGEKDADDKQTKVEEKASASYDEFMEIYEQYENETDETKKREQLDKIQAILDSVSEK